MITISSWVASSGVEDDISERKSDKLVQKISAQSKIWEGKMQGKT